MKHPEQKHLRNYALGSMDITLRLLIESHLEYCEACEKNVREIRDTDLATPSDDGYIGPPQPVAPSGILAALMESLPELPNVQEVEKPKGDGAYLPKFMTHEVEQEEEWMWTTMWPAKGRIGSILEDPDTGYSLYLVYFKAGERAPKHKHLDDEFTVMLQGGYTYNDTHITVGDWDWAPTDSIHSPKIDSNEDCWCVVRSKTKRSVQFKGTAAWRQPFVMLANRE